LASQLGANIQQKCEKSDLLETHD